LITPRQTSRGKLQNDLQIDKLISKKIRREGIVSDEEKYGNDSMIVGVLFDWPKNQNSALYS
jgi:hypothetical protein